MEIGGKVSGNNSALMYFSALMDSVILLLLLLHCLHCTVIQLFGYLHSCKCAK